MAAQPERLASIPLDAHLRERLDAILAAGEASVVLLHATAAGTATPGPAVDLLWLERFPLPVVAAVEGPLDAAATGIVLAADVRVAAEGSSFAFAAAPGSVTANRVRTLLPRSPLAARLLAGQRVSAAEAFAGGLVSAFTPPAGALAEAQRLAGVIASRGPIAVRLGKEALWRGIALPLEPALRLETDLTLLLQTTKDRAEGVAAFLARRSPHFTGT